MNGTDEMIEDAYLLQHLLETTRNELNAAHRANQELRKRERELTDRSVGRGRDRELTDRSVGRGREGRGGERGGEGRGGGRGGEGEGREGGEGGGEGRGGEWYSCPRSANICHCNLKDRIQALFHWMLNVGWLVVGWLVGLGDRWVVRVTD